MARTELEKWMEVRSKKDPWLATVLGVSLSQASRIRRGKSRPSLDGAAELNRLTRIPVSRFTLLADVEAQPEERAA